MWVKTKPLCRTYVLVFLLVVIILTFALIWVHEKKSLTLFVLPTRQEFKFLPLKTVNDFASEEWFTQLVPKHLHSFFNVYEDKHHKLFKKTVFTERMMRRSRAHVGDTQRLHAALYKGLVLRKCLKIAVVGASVTGGRNVGFNNSFSQAFRTWINGKYECTYENGTKGEHTVTRLGIGGLNSCVFFYTLLSETNMKTLEGLDMLWVEFHVNDNFLETDKTLKFKFKREPPHFASKAENLQFCIEGIIRRVLQIKKPHPIALMWLIADQMRPKIDPARDNDPVPENEHHGISQFAYMPILWWYGIPTISLIDGYFHLGLPHFFDYDNEFNLENFHTDSTCHPYASGHRLIALMMAYNMELELRWMNNVPRHSFERDFTLERLPISMRMTPEQSKFFDSASESYAVDFGNWKNPPDLKNRHLFPYIDDAWKIYNDASKNALSKKFGMISTVAYSHFAIRFRALHKDTIVAVTFLNSYEKVSIISMYITKPGYVPNKPCGDERRRKEWVDFAKMRALWYSKASVYNLFNFLHLGVGEYLLHFCLLPDPKDHFAKFKIVKVAVI